MIPLHGFIFSVRSVVLANADQVSPDRGRSRARLANIRAAVHDEPAAANAGGVRREPVSGPLGRWATGPNGSGEEQIRVSPRIDCSVRAVSVPDFGRAGSDPLSRAVPFYGAAFASASAMARIGS